MKILLKINENVQQAFLQHHSAMPTRIQVRMYVCAPCKFLQSIVGDYFAYLKSGLFKRFRGKWRTVAMAVAACRVHPKYLYLRECVMGTPCECSNTRQSAKLAMVILNYFLSAFVCRALLQF